MNRTGQQVNKKPTPNNVTASTDANKKPTNPTTNATSDENEESNSSAVSTTNTGGATSTKDEDDIYEFKCTPKDSSSSGDDKSDAGKVSDKSSDEKSSTENEVSTTVTAGSTAAAAQNKRPYTDVETTDDQSATDDDSKRNKKRKDEGGKEGAGPGPKTGTGIRIPIRQEKGTKIPGPASKTQGVTKTTPVERKSPVPSPKQVTKGNDSDTENDEKSSNSDGPKVPPLKIVIPQQNNAGDQETGTTRNGKNASTRNHPALPYVVASSNSNDSTADKESSSSRCASPVDPLKMDNEKPEKGQERLPRVLRSSHRGQSNSADRSSNNSSPQLQNSSSPSPAGGNAGEEKEKTKENNLNATSPANPSTTEETSAPPPPPVTTSAAEMHPRKRKIRQNREQAAAAAAREQAAAEQKVEEKPDQSASDAASDQPFTNCYQMYVNLKKQIDRRRRGLFPVQPKPPQGFKDYLLNRRTYVLEGKAPKEPTIVYPTNLPAAMKELFVQQERERHKLKIQHIVEKEKLVLAVEQEILRVHGRAARALANQSLPFSVCTILKDDEVYNMITPEQEIKDMNARSRYNGRLFLSWLQDVDDKWEKIKEAMLLRHHNEAESLHAVQKMDWEWKLKENSLCEWKAKAEIDDTHVPEVYVSDDFDLLPA